jgi:cytochrome P450
MRRTVTQDTEVRGTKWKTGDKVSVWCDSANCDEDTFGDTWRFDIGRAPNPHIGFGAGGVHFCANLARREITVAFDKLRRQIPDIVAIGEPTNLRSAFVHGIKRLPVGWTPRDV